jgi:uncharacterized SAM-binding protein YcdF (DUF218 family)
MKKLQKIGCGLIAAVSVTILGMGLASPAVLLALGHWLDVGRPPQKADAAVLLNGSYNSRPFVAAALVHGGWAAKVILNTVALHAAESAGAVPRSHEIALRVLEYGGVARKDVVLLDTSARTTFDEAAGVARYLDTHDVKRLLLVTEWPHMRRSLWIFQKVLAGRQVEVVPISAPTEDFDFAIWWQSEAGFIFVISEYFKLMFYAVRYGWLAYEIVAVLAAVMIFGAWYSRRRKRNYKNPPFGACP